jgi:hypothetical protein
LAKDTIDIENICAIGGNDSADRERARAVLSENDKEVSKDINSSDIK